MIPGGNRHHHHHRRPSVLRAARLALGVIGALLALPGCVFRHAPNGDGGGTIAFLAAAPPIAGRWPARYDAPFTDDVCAEPWWRLDRPVCRQDYGSMSLTEKVIRPEIRGFYGRAPARMLVARMPTSTITPLECDRATLRADEWVQISSWHALPPDPATDHLAREVFVEPGSDRPAPILSPGMVESILRITVIAAGTATTSAALVLPEGEPVGTALYLASAIGVSLDDELLAEFVRRGWAVVIVWPPTGGLLADPRWRRELTFNIDNWLTDELRMVRQTPLAKRSEQVRPDTMARTLGHGATQFLSEWAYAADAAMDCFTRERPALARGPFVMVGASLGAISLPAVAARIERQPDAAVFLAGGASFARIIYRGLASVRAIEDQRAYWDEVERLYPRYAPLDAVNTAPAMKDRGVPVLQIHAMFDCIVPASSGRALWEALGRPERWDLPVGHGGAFFLSGLYAGDVLNWVEARVGAADGNRVHHGANRSRLAESVMSTPAEGPAE